MWERNARLISLPVCQSKKIKKKHKSCKLQVSSKERKCKERYKIRVHLVYQSANQCSRCELKNIILYSSEKCKDKLIDQSSY